MSAMIRSAGRAVAPAWRRAAATGVDYALVIVWLAVLAAIALGLRRVGALTTELPASGADRIRAQLVIALVLTVPVTLWLSWWEARRGSTPGKKLLRLCVESVDSRRLSMSRALLRSGIKVALPWELAHAAIWQTIGRDTTTLTLLLGGLAYLVMGAHLALLCVGGRPIYDRAAGTVVRTVSPHAHSRDIPSSR